MAATHSHSVLDAVFLVLALLALAILVSIVAMALIGGIWTGAAGGTLGTPGLLVAFFAAVALLGALTALILDQTRD